MVINADGLVRRIVLALHQITATVAATADLPVTVVGYDDRDIAVSCRTRPG